MAVLAIDVGTSSVKCAVSNRSEVVNVPYHLDYPTPDAAEVPTERVWDAIVRGVRKVDPEGVSALGLSCMTPALVVLDRADRPLAPVITHLDRRSQPTAARIWQEAPELLSECGNRPLAGGISAVSFQHLEVAGVRHYLHLNGWLGLKLTGERRFDPANAAFTGLKPLFSNDWSDKWCRYFRIDQAWLPPIVDGSQTLGGLRSEAARELGIPAGIPVKSGSADTSSALLAARLAPGELLHVVGTTQVLVSIVATPCPSEGRLVRPIGVGAGFVHVTHNPVGGAAFEWLRDLVFPNVAPAEFYGEALREISGRGTSVVLDPPYLGGDRLEIGESSAAFRNLRLTTTRSDLLAALTEAMRRGHKRALERLGIGDHFNRVVVTGGGAVWAAGLLHDRFEILKEGSLEGVIRLFQQD